MSKPLKEILMPLRNPQAAQEMLDAFDAFMSEKDMTAEQECLHDRLVIAGCYAAAAYDDCAQRDGGEVLDLTRAFLLALTDPLHEELDYLRQDPSCGALARAERKRKST